MHPDAMVLPVEWVVELERRLVCEQDAPPVVRGPVAPHHGNQKYAKIPKRSGILDLQDPGFEILEYLGSYLFIFSWDLKDLGSCHGNIAVGS